MFREFLRKMRHETRNKRKIPFPLCRYCSLCRDIFPPKSAVSFSNKRGYKEISRHCCRCCWRLQLIQAGQTNLVSRIKLSSSFQNKLVRVFYYERFLFHLWRFCLCPSFNQEDNKGKLPVFENSLSLRTYQGTQSKSWSKLITFCNFTRLHGIARDIIKLSLVPDLAF